MTKLKPLNKHHIVSIYLHIKCSTNKRIYKHVTYTRVIELEDVVICVRVLFCNENNLHGADLKLIPQVE